MGLIVAIGGYLILVGMTVLLYLLTFAESLKHGQALLFGVVGAPVLAGLGYGMFLEWRSAISGKGRDAFRFDLGDLQNFFAVFLGTLVTYGLSRDFGLGPVVAAGLVGVIAALVLPKFGVPIYCGAFAGMSCYALFGAYVDMVFAGLLAGTVFVVTKSVFNGFGGKLGTIAFTACVLSAVLPGKSLNVAEVPGWHQGRLIVGYAILGAMLTFLLSVRLKHGAVMASGIVGLCGGMLLTTIHGDFGRTLGVVVICASFAGMSSPERMPNEVYMLLAGILCGFVFIYSSPHLGGAGGKLGTIAFGSVIALKGIMLATVALGRFGARTRLGARALSGSLVFWRRYAADAQLDDTSSADS